jgi:rubrerythrin
LLSAAASQNKEKQQNMILSPASTKWRGAYYACRICKHNADFIAPRGLTPICAECKARYVGIFGYEAFEIMREERKSRGRK